jgi:hypothetical protein
LAEGCGTDDGPYYPGDNANNCPCSPPGHWECDGLGDGEDIWVVDGSC